ncbi:MAG: HigA family addiction module antitoxin [Hyphomonadaceae bacterium]|nr:HigA family addiction module antitoxin [Hyphomonadaceae bacterium]
MSRSSTTTTRRRAALGPVHPGAVLREEFLKPLELSPYTVARACHVPRTRIERLAREETPVTADTALRLARVLNTTPDFWMALQTRYDLEAALHAGSADFDLLSPIARR